MNSTNSSNPSGTRINNNLSVKRKTTLNLLKPDSTNKANLNKSKKIKPNYLIAILMIIIAILFIALFIFVALYFQDNYEIKEKTGDIDNKAGVGVDNNKESGESAGSGVTSLRCLQLGCPEGTQYVGSINSDKFYECDCHYANRILEENVVCFRTEQQAKDEGRVRSEC